MLRHKMRILIFITVAALAAQRSSSHPLDGRLSSGDAKILTADGRTIDISQIIGSIRGQIKEAVAELTGQATSYLIQSIEIARVKILRKLGPVTLGSIFQWFFDGVPGFIESQSNWGSSPQHWNSPVHQNLYNSVSNGHQSSWIEHSLTTKKYEDDLDLFSLLSQKAPGSSMKDEYSDIEDDDSDDDEPNDVVPDEIFSFKTFMEQFNNNFRE